MKKCLYCLLCSVLCIAHAANAQYILNGSAQKISCNCYTLTQDQLTQSGSVWNSNKIDLRIPFDFTFNVFLGCKDQTGADGIVFILQPLSTSLGTSGEGMGFQGISPSIGISLDTWQNFNLNDPSFDHICIQSNGQSVHGSSDLAPAIPASATSDNIEDCQWHTLRIKWNVSNDSLTTYFDGVFREGIKNDIVATIFNGDPMVYWGFSAATGGASNVQQFCTALNPDFTTNFSNNAACAPAIIQFTDQSVSFAPIANYNWSFGNGNTSNVINPTSQGYSQPGAYQVKLSITGLDGCTHDTTKTINIGAVPSAQMNVFDTCFKKVPRVAFSQNAFGINYQWSIDGSSLSSQQPNLSTLNAGSHDLELIASSIYNCSKPDTASRSFIIKPLPQVASTYSQLCKQINFTASQSDNQTTILQWNWLFGDNTNSVLQNPVHNYFQQGQYSARLWANANNGCSSDTMTTVVTIPSAFAFAGNDTAVIMNRPFQLQGKGTANASFQWSPSTGLSNPFITNPVATLNQNEEYILTVTTTEGCVATDDIKIKVFVGPTVYVPSAFTPNGDGLNDILRPVYVGISKLEKFAVYNRWGQLVFETSDMSKGWDGRTQQNIESNSVYVWLVKAVTDSNESLVLKGTVTIIR